MKHYQTYNLRSHILKLLHSTFLNPVIEAVADSSKLKINKLFLPKEQKKRILRRNKQYRRYNHNKERKKYDCL